MTKTILVKTDDPDNKVFNLVVKGPVEKIAEISPESVFLKGNPGDTLEALVTISPSEKYMFSVLGMEQKNNAKIKAELVNPSGNQKSWQVKIKSTSDRVEDFYDILTLKTDSRYSNVLTIRVYVSFFGKQAPKS